MSPTHVAHGSSGAGSNLVSCSRTDQHFGSLCVAKGWNSGDIHNYKSAGLFSNFLPRLMSPISFFFGPFPKLLLRDHEKKMPRFLSALSSLLSSFSDLPDLCFLISCWLQNKKNTLHTHFTCFTGLKSTVNNVIFPRKALYVPSKK